MAKSGASEETTKGLTADKLKDIDGYPSAQNTTVDGITWFKEDSYKGTSYDWLKKVFSKASKKQTMKSKGTPDFVVTLDDSEIILLIECKGDVNNHSQFDDVNDYVTYGYGTLIHLMGMEETWEIVDKVIQSLPKEQLPIDTQKYLEVCTLEEGTSSLDYLISYMSYKGYSIMSKENGYFYCFEQDFESLSNQLLETFSSIQVEDAQGNIIKELECIDCYVFYKEDALVIENNKYAVVLITEDNNECFYDVIGNVYFIKYGYYDVMGDIYGALETWKVNI